VKLRSRTVHLGGALTPALDLSSRRPRGRRAVRCSLVVLVAAICGFFAGCGVEAPPQPPRVETPAKVTDLRVIQIGGTYHFNFTLPVLASDGERLEKPVSVEIFRAVAPPGETPALPRTAANPWVTLSPDALARYARNDKVDYPWLLSGEDYRQWQNSAFAFSVVAFTRGFRGRTHESSLSNVVRTKLLDASAPVTNLTVQTTQAALRLSWASPAETLTGRPASHLAAYRVYESRTGEEPASFRLLAETKSSPYDDPNFQFGESYYFRVSAVSVVSGVRLESDSSAAIEVTPKDTFPPAIPQGLTAVYAAGAVDLIWNANTDADLAGYNVYRKAAGGEFARVNPHRLSTPIFHDTSVAPDRLYQYAVTAVDLAGNESAQSQPISVSTHLPGQP
jgi:hypothetical protein